MFSGAAPSRIRLPSIHTNTYVLWHTCVGTRLHGRHAPLSLKTHFYSRISAARLAPGARDGPKEVSSKRACRSYCRCSLTSSFAHFFHTSLRASTCSDDCRPSLGAPFIPDGPACSQACGAIAPCHIAPCRKHFCTVGASRPAIAVARSVRARHGPAHLDKSTADTGRVGCGRALL